MMPFYLAVTALVVVALALLLRPWWRASRRIASAEFSPALNAAVHRDRLAELERDRDGGSLSAADFAEARDELQRQLLDDTAADASANSSNSTNATRSAGPASRASGIALALLVPVLAVLLYALLGSPATVLPEAVQKQRAAEDMEQTLVKLANKLEQNPNNPEGWTMLARSYKSLGRWDDAERAFGRIGPAFEQNPDLLAEVAEMLVQKHDGFTDRSRELTQRALRLAPNNMLALFLGGSEAFAAGRHMEAATLWERLLPQLEPGGEDARMVESGIAMARESAGKPATGKAKGGAKAAASSVSGRVELAAALKEKASPDDVVFIFARAVDGPRMPLAARRARVADLPLEFTLDDSQALMPEATLSSVRQVRIEARVSKSGKATPTPGDLTGKSAVVKPGARGVRLAIDQVEP